MEQPIPKQERKREFLEDIGKEDYNNLENNQNAGSRNYTDYIEKTKGFGRKHQLSPEKLLYERDSYVAQGTFGEGDQTLARAQASLSIAGYDLGNTGYKGVDGKMGPKTEAALRQVQSAAGLEPTGKLDRQTAEVLEKISASGMKKEDIETMGRRVKNGSDSHEQRMAQRDELVRQAQDKCPERDMKLMQAQASLRLAGYDLGKSGIDGIVGEKTQKAIADYQKARGLKITGELNAETIKALEETVKSGWTKGQEQVALRNELFKGGQGKGQDLVAYAQASLVAAGYDLGNSGFKGVDGKPGPLTVKATKEFQETHGLEPTGRLDQRTLWALEKATQEGWGKRPGTSEVMSPNEEIVKKDHNHKLKIQRQNLFSEAQSLIKEADKYSTDSKEFRKFIGKASECLKKVDEISGNSMLTPVEQRGGGRIQENHEPSKENLVTLKGVVGNYPLDYRAARAYLEMVIAARKEGVNLLGIKSGYRSVEHQKRLFEEAVQKQLKSNPKLSRAQAEEIVDNWVGRPGGSHHHSGRTVDLDMGIPNNKYNVKKQRETDQYIWLEKHAKEFGFYNYEKEPWHWEYNPPRI